MFAVVPPNPAVLFKTALLRALIADPAPALIAVPLCISVVSLTVRLEPDAEAITPLDEFVEMRQSSTITKELSEAASTPDVLFSILQFLISATAKPAVVDTRIPLTFLWM